MHPVKDRICLCRPSSENADNGFDTFIGVASFILWRLEKMKKAGNDDSGGRADYTRSLSEYVLKLQSGKKCLTEEDKVVLSKLSAMPPSHGIISIFSTAIKASLAGAIIGGFGGMSFGVTAWGINVFPGVAYWGAGIIAILFGLIGAFKKICEPERLRLERYIKHDVYEKHRHVIFG